MRDLGDVSTLTVDSDHSKTKSAFSGTTVVVSSFGNEKRGSLVLYEKHHEFGSSCLAGVPSDGVHVVRVLVERLAWHQSDGALAFHLHHDRPFDHIDHDLCMVCVGRIGRSWLVLHCDHREFF